MQSFIDGRDFMTRDESIALYERAQAAEKEKKGGGRKVWNAWLLDVLCQKAELQLSGKWKLDKKATSAWKRVARLDFSHHIFQNADFADQVFPAEAIFCQATFSGNAEFGGTTFQGNAKFDNATFQGGAGLSGSKFQEQSEFVGVTFQGEARFNRVKFQGATRFSRATFEGAAGFSIATFQRDAWFLSATFKGDAKFGGATLKGAAGFGGATFKGGAWFDGATFKGDGTFANASFKGNAWFGGATFKEAAGFGGATCRGSFSLKGAEFQKVPDFVQSAFAEAPRFDNMFIRLSERDPDDAARYRALKGLALKGHDHDSELSFFAGEIISRRGVEDFALPRPSNILRAWKLVPQTDEKPERKLVWRWQKGKFQEHAKIWSGGARYWAGQTYEILSDFGHSMLRPLGWWVVLIGMYAIAFLSQYFAAARSTTGLEGLAEAYRWVGAWLLNKLSFGSLAAPAKLACHSTSELVDASKMEPWGAAGYVAARRALILNTGDDDDKLSFAYACLYGDYTAEMTNGDPTRSVFRVIPHIPDTVSALAIMQSLLSAALIFLFLLAVRNQFRIK
jgi:Pentapeptide repeats (9 copies)